MHFARLVLTTAIVLTPITAKAADRLHFDGRVAPFGLRDLPASGLRTSLEVLGPDARAAALDWLNSHPFPAADAAALRADRGGAIFYADYGLSSRARPGGGPVHAERPAAGLVPDIAPDKVFRLHSKPKSKNRVYLDFRGGTITGTAWNNGRKPSYKALPYSEDADTSTFDQGEMNTIADVWRRMADDFAPFDLDVTTEPPPAFGPTTMRVMFTPLIDAEGSPIVDGSPGGIAYVGIWGRSDATTYQPAFVFSDRVYPPKDLAEAGSHELGHNLGLSHDGTSTTGYYGGHGTGYTSWGPIMGVGYYADISTWSKGEYFDANNQEDDMAIIAGNVGWAADDHGNTPATASTLVIRKGKINSVTEVTSPASTSKVNRGVIGNSKDLDVFCADVTGTGKASIVVTPAYLHTFVQGARRGDDLDVKIAFYRQTGTGLGTLVSANNISTDTRAVIRPVVTPGRYCLTVRGVGRGDPKGTGYTAYGSIGRYNIRGSIPMAP